MGIKHRLKRAEQEAAELFEEIRLENGEVVRYSGTDAFEAVRAAAAGKQHWLIEPFLSAETTEGLPGLVRALVGSRERMYSCTEEDA